MTPNRHVKGTRENSVDAKYQSTGAIKKKVGEVFEAEAQSSWPISFCEVNWVVVPQFLLAVRLACVAVLKPAAASRNHKQTNSFYALYFAFNASFNHCS